MRVTESQELALAGAYLMLEDAFDHVLVVVRDQVNPGEIIQADCEVCWSGGLPTAEYMAHQGLKRLDYSKNGRRPPAVSKKIMDELMRGRVKPKG